MARAARELGMACRTAEQRGLPIKWSNLSSIFDEVSFGQGTVSARYHVFWTNDPLNLKLTAIKDASIDSAPFKASSALHKKVCAVKWGFDIDKLRGASITSKEDFDQVVKSLLSDKSWRQAVYPSKASQNAPDLIEQLLNQTNREELLTREQLTSLFYADTPMTMDLSPTDA